MFGKSRKRIINILSIDGGGIRGIVPAVVLQYIYNRLKNLGLQTPLYDFFDLISATSTGSLIAAGIAHPVNPMQPSEVAEFYHSEGPQIFSRPGRTYLRRYMDTMHLEYNHQIFEEILRRHFGDETLSGCRTEVLVTAFDSMRMKPYLFRRHRTLRDGGYDYYLREIIRAATAAPSYFKPALVQVVGKPELAKRVLLDGGIYADNPAMIAFQEARKLFPDAHKYLILSLGTGRSELHYSYNKLSKFNSLDWINPFRGIPLLQMNGEAQDMLTNITLSGMPDAELFRINGNIGDCSMKLDDADPENIRCIDKFATQVINQSSLLINRYIERVQKL